MYEKAMDNSKQQSLLELLQLNFTAKPQPDSPSASAEAKADNKNEGSPPITAITMPSITQAIKNELNITISPKSNPASLPPNIPASVEPIMTTQENNKPPTITTEDTSKYMAIHLVDQIKNSEPASTIFLNPFSTAESTSQSAEKPTILASPHPNTDQQQQPRKSNVGLRINSSFPPQELVISTTQINPEILYTADPVPHVLPITLFPSAMIFSPGNKVAVDGFISYATKAGRIRVIDQNSGARMLLRKHEGPIIDMCIGRPRAAINENTSTPNTTSSNNNRRWRCILSAGSDGRLIIWKVPIRFEEDNVGYEILSEINSVDSHSLIGPEKLLTDRSKNTRFLQIKTHPKDPSIFLVSTNDCRLILVRLDRGIFNIMWKRGLPIGKSISELEAFEGQDVLRLNCDVVAFAFSPDGTAFAFITSDNILTVRQTSKPHWTIMGGQLSKKDGPISRLEFLSTPNGIIKGFLISKNFGTRVEVVQLSEISDIIISINLQPPPIQDDHEAAPLPCFGHLAWQNQYSTILLSNSLRGSIFTFHLNFCEDPTTHEEEPATKPSSRSTNKGGGLLTTQYQSLQPPSQEDDSTYIERVAANRQSTSSSTMHRSRSNSWVAARTMFVDRISEIPSPDPIISFVLDQGMRPPPGPSSSNCSIFNLHPKGIHQLYIPKDVIDFNHLTTLNQNINSLPSSSSSSSDTVPAILPTRSKSLVGEILVDVRVEQEIDRAEILTFSPMIIVLNMLLLLKHRKNYRRKINHQIQNSNRLYLLHLNLNLIEVESRRHEHLLNLVSTGLSSKNFAKVLENSINDHFNSQVNDDPLGKRDMVEVLKQNLGQEIEKVFLKPQVIESISTRIIENFNELNQRNMKDLIKETQKTQQVYNHELLKQVQTLSNHVKNQAMNNNDNHQQSQINQLNETVNDLKNQIHLLHDTLKLVVVQPSSSTMDGGGGQMRGEGSSSRGSSWKHESDIVPDHQIPTQEDRSLISRPSSTPTTSAPIIRSHPNLSSHTHGQSMNTNYEEIFLEALSDPNKLGLLSKLIDDQEFDILHLIFPKPTSTSTSNSNKNHPLQSKLSQPVLLTLAHKLSEDLATPMADSNLVRNPTLSANHQMLALGASGANRLRWIWSCIGAINEQDHQTAQYLDRVLDICYSNLHTRKLKLIKENGIKDEIHGINEVLWIIQDKLNRFRNFKISN
ncbi:hypothetical protein PSHT_03882 [Puccinia striiformis]|uniref:Enhancer of mRNA-decapping protein 4 WD40 repeat region domain-containing protein n=1 Tax=Puccinia striiformis TaxID=27350 RepID=A0A2S4WEA0_9BASI|nr:hypothetical protein PSHT_03882 [Puccinia striiformis]